MLKEDKAGISTKSKSSSVKYAEQPLSLRVLDGDGEVLSETGLFTGSASLCCSWVGDACLELRDEEDELVAQMFLHAVHAVGWSSSLLGWPPDCA